jgi:hypothetical protein
MAAALLPPAVMLAAPAPAAQAGFENVTVLVGGYEVFGRLPEAAEGAAAVRAAVLRPDGVARAEAQAPVVAGGDFELAFRTSGATAHRPVGIQPGDRVLLRPEVAEPPAVLELAIPPLTAEASVGSQHVAGDAPAGVRLTVTAAPREGGLWPSRTATADATGRWSVDLGRDLAVGDHGAVLFADQGRAFQRAWVVRGAEVRIGSAWLPVYAPPGEAVSAELTRADGSSSATGDTVTLDHAGRIWLGDRLGHAAPLLPGDHLVVRFGSGERLQVTLPGLAEVAVDPEGDEVTGRTVAGREVLAVAAGVTRTALADGQGRFRLAFDGAVDLDLDSAVDLAESGDEQAALVGPVWLRAYAPAPLRVDALAAAVSGRGVAGDPVSLALRDGAGDLRGRQSGRVASDGHFELAVWADHGQPMALQAGDRLEVQRGAETVQLSGQPLAVAVDTALGVLEGTTRPGSDLQVHVDSEGLAVRADDAGRWRVELADVAALAPGTTVGLAIQDPAGHVTEFDVPVFRASVQANGERVRLEGPPRLAATVQVIRDGAAIGRGECRIARTVCEAVVAAADGTVVRLQPGDEVQVFPSEGETAAPVVQLLTAHIDAAGTDVVGQGPPEQPVQVEFANDQGLPTPLGATLGTDAAGVYDHEVSASEWSLMAPGLVADVFYRLADGHRLFARGVLEVVRVTPGEATVRGIAEPGAAVTAWLGASEAAALARGQAVAAGDGGFALTLRDAQDQAVAVHSGQRLGLTHSRGSAEHEITPLAAWPAGGDGALVGVAAPGAPLRATVTRRAAPGEPSFVTVEGVADRFGLFSLPGPGLDRAAVLAVEVVCTAAGGVEVRLPVDPTRAPGRAFLPLARRD